MFFLWRHRSKINSVQIKESPPVIEFLYARKNRVHISHRRGFMLLTEDSKIPFYAVITVPVFPLIASFTHCMEVIRTLPFGTISR